VLRRPAGDSSHPYEVLVVHRPRYDDWSLPKGKDEPGESPEAAAVREVLEEAGQPTRIISALGKSSYQTVAGDKTVQWFAMRATGPLSFVANGEVDRIEWLPPEAAVNLLTYPRDRQLVSSIDGEALLATGTFYLVRHGAAGDRNLWKGDDTQRPLTVKGERQAEAIARILQDEEIERIISSPYLRCTQTVEPLAAATGLPLEIDDSLAEAEGGKPTRDLIKALAGTNAVLCSHGDVIPALLDWMVRRGMLLKSIFDCKKGSIWQVDINAGEFQKARYFPPPEV
jgi:8-oxo-dGTP diphosphatase